MAAKEPLEIPAGMRSVCRRFERWRKRTQGPLADPRDVSSGIPSNASIESVRSRRRLRFSARALLDRVLASQDRVTPNGHPES
jgi:hypothetical protein